MSYFYPVYGKLKFTLIDDLASGVTASTSFRVYFTDSDTGDARTVTSGTILAVSMKDKGSGAEFCLMTVGATASGITTITTMTRGLDPDGTYVLTGNASLAKQWEAGSEGGVTTHFLNLNRIRAVFDGNLSTGANELKIGDATASDATITHTSNAGNEQFVRHNITTGKVQFKNTGGAWTNNDAPGVGVLTAGRQINSTQLGLLTLQVDENYALDTGAADAYVVSIPSLITPYTTGEKIRFKATNANTGASTIAVNGGAAKAIKRFNSTTALSAGDIPLNGIVELVYDGTNYQLYGGSMSLTQIPEVTATATELNKMSGASANVTSTNLNTLTGGGDADALHIHSGALIAAGGFATTSNANNAAENKDTTIAIDAGLTAGKIGIEAFVFVYDADSDATRVYKASLVFNGLSFVYGAYLVHPYSETADLNHSIADASGSGTAIVFAGIGATTKRNVEIQINSITAGSGNDVTIRCAYTIVGSPGTNASAVNIIYKIYQA